ncbi:reverse transcriptase domain-containing protein [Tanacetum coccineum]
MYTRGRKKAKAAPAPPACDPRDVETIERLQQRIQELKFQQLQQDSPTEEAESESNVWDDGPEDVNPFGGRKPSMGLKIEIPEFTCKVHPDDFIDWLSTVERVFDVHDIPDKLKVKLMAIKLRQHALLWWDHVTERRRIEGKSKVETWEKMKKLMKAKFLLKNHRQEAFPDYHNLSQQNMTVEEVINEFDKMRMRCDVVEEEKQTYTDVCRLALKVEKHIKAKTPKATTPTTSAASNTREHVNNAPRCYKCSRVEHYARDCLNLKTLAFIPDDVDPINDTDAALELAKPGDELVYLNHGEALVIQRVLNVAVSKSVDDNSWLRNNIFRTKCTSKGNVSHPVSGENTGMRHNDLHCTIYKIILYICIQINSELVLDLVPNNPYLPLLTIHLKLILENANNNVGELVGFDSKPSHCANISYSWTIVLYDCEYMQTNP